MSSVLETNHSDGRTDCPMLRLVRTLLTDKTPADRNGNAPQCCPVNRTCRMIMICYSNYTAISIMNTTVSAIFFGSTPLPRTQYHVTTVISLPRAAQNPEASSYRKIAFK